MGKWDWSRLDGLAQIAKGRLLPTSGLRFESSVRYFGAADLEGRDSGLYSPTSNAVLCDEDDVLMLWDGERSGLVGCGLSGAAGSTVARIRPLRAKVVSKYLYHYLTSRFAEIQSLRTGTGVPHVPRDLKSFLKVPVPPLEEQRRIAEILDTIDENVQATERVIAKLMRMRDGLRRSQFADLVSSSELCPVSECFEMILGKMLSPVSRTGSSPAPYLANRNVQWERCWLDNLDEMDFTPSERTKFSLEPGDVLICEGGRSWTHCDLAWRARSLLLSEGNSPPENSWTSDARIHASLHEIRI